MSQPSTSDVERVVTAASDLAIKGREQRWTHLSLCVLKAASRSAALHRHYPRMPVQGVGAGYR